MKFNNVDIFGDIKVYDEEGILKKIDNERLFFVHNSTDGDFYLIEGCDSHFGVKLTSELCDDLSKVFQHLSEHIMLQSKT